MPRRFKVSMPTCFICNVDWSPNYAERVYKVENDMRSKRSRRFSLHSLRTNPIFALLIAMAICLSLLPHLYDSAFATDFVGHLTAILDGDRVDISSHEIEETVRLRLFGIDAPEKDQPYWQEAKDFLGNLLAEKKVEVTLRGGFFKERDGRSVATVILPDGSTASRALVNAGLAWVHEEDFSKKQDDTLDGKEELNALEQEAREAKRGLWADPKPVPPWLYRRLKSGAYP